MPIKYYDGTGWVTISSSNVKDYDGTSWTAVNDASYWDGSAWQSLFGSSVTIVDSAEDNDIAEYGGDTGGYSVVTSPVSDGSYAIQASVSSGGNVSIASTTGLDAYPSQGDTFRFDVQVGSVATLQWNIGYFSQSEASLPDGYYAQLDISNGDLALRLRQNGSNSQLTSTAVDYTGIDTAYWTVEVATATDGTHTVTLYDGSDSQVGQISATDTTFTSGGVAYQLYDGQDTMDAWADYYRIL